MALKELDTLLAIKVLSYAPGLTANARAVGTLLIDRYNRKTGRCDPGLESVATHLGINSRTVIRSVHRLEAAGLLRKLRHGGYGNRNQYEPNWTRFRELEAEWCARLRRQRSDAGQKVSVSKRQNCHVQGDRAVTQTYQTKLQTKKPCSGGRPNEEIGRTSSSAFRGIVITPGSQDVAEAEAERRWTNSLHRAFASQPMTYGEIIAAITAEIQAAATKAELKHRGSGFAYVLRRLKLGDDPAQATRAPEPSTPSAGDGPSPLGSFHDDHPARGSNRDGSPVTHQFQSLNTPKHTA